MKLNRTLVATTAGATMIVLGAGQGAVAATVGAPTSATSAPAAACSASALAYLRAGVDLAVARRERTITALSAALAARRHLTDAHRATLAGAFTADAAALRAVNAR